MELAARELFPEKCAPKPEPEAKPAPEPDPKPEHSTAAEPMQTADSAPEPQQNGKANIQAEVTGEDAANRVKADDAAAGQAAGLANVTEAEMPAA